MRTLIALTLMGSLLLTLTSTVCATNLRFGITIGTKIPAGLYRQHWNCSPSVWGYLLIGFSPYVDGEFFAGISMPSEGGLWASGAKLHTYQLGGGVRVNPPLKNPFRPYITGGLGMYSYKADKEIHLPCEWTCGYSVERWNKLCIYFGGGLKYNLTQSLGIDIPIRLNIILNKVAKDDHDDSTNTNWKFLTLGGGITIGLF